MRTALRCRRLGRRQGRIDAAALPRLPAQRRHMRSSMLAHFAFAGAGRCPGVGRYCSPNMRREFQLRGLACRLRRSMPIKSPTPFSRAGRKLPGRRRNHRPGFTTAPVGRAASSSASAPPGPGMGKASEPRLTYDQAIMPKPLLHAHTDGSRRGQPMPPRIGLITVGHREASRQYVLRGSMSVSSTSAGDAWPPRRLEYRPGRRARLLTAIRPPGRRVRSRLGSVKLSTSFPR